jgi:hypothetical protein
LLPSHQLVVLALLFLGLSLILGLLSSLLLLLLALLLGGLTLLLLDLPLVFSLTLIVGLIAACQRSMQAKCRQQGEGR